MRTFIVYSKTASTAPFHKDLKKAGRWDILLHSIISALFASNEFRNDVELHLILMGPPTSPRHITISYNENNTISKKDLKKLIEISLRRYKEGQIREVHPGVFVDNKSIDKVLKDFKEEKKEISSEHSEQNSESFKEEKKEIFVLDGNGILIKEVEKKKLENCVFILGDHEGFDKKVKKFLKKNCQRLSLGPQIYFTSQAITIINYELDNL